MIKDTRKRSRRIGPFAGCFCSCDSFFVFVLQDLLNSPETYALICLWNKRCNRWLTYCQLNLVVSGPLTLYDGVEVMDNGFCR